jgi:hypothetical protein
MQDKNSLLNNITSTLVDFFSLINVSFSVKKGGKDHNNPGKILRSDVPYLYQYFVFIKI